MSAIFTFTFVHAFIFNSRMPANLSIWFISSPVWCNFLPHLSFRVVPFLSRNTASEYWLQHINKKARNSSQNNSYLNSSPVEFTMWKKGRTQQMCVWVMWVCVNDSTKINSNTHSLFLPLSLTYMPNIHTQRHTHTFYSPPPTQDPWTLSPNSLFVMHL